MLILVLTLTSLAARLESVVLDPALYLAPSPPLMPTSDSIPPEELWLMPLESRTDRVERAATDTTTTEKPHMESARMFWPSQTHTSVGINLPLTFSLSGSYGKPIIAPMGFVGNTYTSLAGYPSLEAKIVPTTKTTEPLTPSPGLGSSLSSIRFSIGPSLSGLGSSKPSESNSGSGSLFGYGKAALAGSSYGSYGVFPSVRVFGGNTAPSWSGWGNGKWGHYGKG